MLDFIQKNQFPLVGTLSKAVGTGKGLVGTRKGLVGVHTFQVGMFAGVNLSKTNVVFYEFDNFKGNSIPFLTYIETEFSLSNGNSVFL